MSSYEDYRGTSGSYDSTRVPIGVEIVVGCFAQTATPLDEMVVLDAGCGTGSYSQELLRFVGRIHAVDISSDMLAIARSKLADARKAKRIEFHHTGLNDLPFEADRLDGITVNQVLHHLEYPKHEDVLRELARVLKPGGALVVNTCSQEQLRKAFWPSALIPEACARIADRYMPIDELEGLMRDCGLTHRGRFVPVDAVPQGDAYFNPRGPLNKEWRDGDSAWALATEPELERALREIRELDRAGALDELIARHDSERRNIGQVTFLFATR